MAKALRYGMMVVFGVSCGAGLVSSLTACPIPTAGIFDAYTSIDGTRRQNIFYTDTKNIQCVAVVSAAQTRPTTVEMLVRQIGDSSGRETNAILAYADFAGAGTQTLSLKPAPKDAGDGTQSTQEAVPFPAGDFTCEIYLDGTAVTPLRFQVRFAECPPQRIENGAKCGGYYTADKVCPKGGFGIPGAPSRGPTVGGNCRCAGDPAAVWVCDGGGP